MEGWRFFLWLFHIFDVTQQDLYGFDESMLKDFAMLVFFVERIVALTHFSHNAIYDSYHCRIYSLIVWIILRH